MASRTIKQVIVIRNDLNMRKGKMCAQASHASMAFLTKNAKIDLKNVPLGSTVDLIEAGQGKIYVFEQSWMKNPLEIKSWLEDGFTKVCLQCNSENELVELYEKALIEGLNVNLIIDSGFTEFGGIPTKTCIAIGPNTNECIDRITGHLKLL